MKSLTSIYNNIQYMIDELEYISEVLTNKKDSIEEKANNLDRDMTSNEQERYDFLDNKIYNVDDCIENLENAKRSLEDYI